MKITKVCNSYSINAKRKRNPKGLNFKQNKTSNIKTDNLNKKLLIITGCALASIAAIALCKKFGVKINNKEVIDKAKELTDKTKEIADKTKEIIVTGSENVKKTVENLKIDDYDSSKIFKANLHIHSTASDGKLTPIEILNQAVECAKKLPDNEKFIFSLTDHDSISGVREIANEIAKNPDKYSKLKFIPGIELSTKHHNLNLSKKPVELDFLIYGFDVNDTKITSEVNRRKNYLSSKTSQLLDLINSERTNADLKINDSDLEKFPLVKNVCSNGYLKSLKEAINKVSGIGLSEENLNEKVRKIFGNDRYAYEANISLAEAVKLAKETNSFSSLAHPGKFNFNHASLIDRHTKLVDDIFNTFFDNGGNAIEYNYMAYNPNRSWWPEVCNRLNNLKSDFLKTGGYDTHGLSILSKH